MRSGLPLIPGASEASAFDVEVFFDGECPLCVREIRLLRRLDKAARIRFTDIQAAGFNLADVGLTHAALMRHIHGRLATGRIIQGVEVFRQLYSAVGFRRLVAATRWPGVRQLLDAAYSLFARNRLRLTGRCTPELCAAPDADRR